MTRLGTAIMRILPILPGCCKADNRSGSIQGPGRVMLPSEWSHTSERRDIRAPVFEIHDRGITDVPSAITVVHAANAEKSRPIAEKAARTGCGNPIAPWTSLPAHMPIGRRSWPRVSRGLSSQIPERVFNLVARARGNRHIGQAGRTAIISVQIHGVLEPGDAVAVRHQK
jgi:hypothetical protein